MQGVRIVGLAAALAALIGGTRCASAGTYAEYPAPTAYPFPRSVLVAGAVVIPPYDHAFRVRVYTTPPQQPIYNVPPYGVITPY